MLERPKDRRRVHAFRCAMLLHGVDLPGLNGMTTAAHTEADIDQTVAAVNGALDLLAEEER
jgi:glutamate-1-semialdehyde 2,1-aminomutase